MRKGHRIRLAVDPRRKGRIESVNVNDPRHLGRYLVAWDPTGHVTQIHPGQLELDPDEPLRGRNVVAEKQIDDWMDYI